MVHHPLVTDCCLITLRPVTAHPLQREASSDHQQRDTTNSPSLDEFAHMGLINDLLE